MGQKVTEQVAEMRSLPLGIDQRSPARHPDWLGPDDLSLKIQEIREATDYQIPIQLKLGARACTTMCAWRPSAGRTSSISTAPRAARARARTSRPRRPVFRSWRRFPRRRALEDVGLADEIDLVVAGGIRNGGDVAKALSLGAKAVAIGHAALVALNCNKEIPGVTDYEGTIGVPAGECYHCLPAAAPSGSRRRIPRPQAARRRRGCGAGLQLPPHADARGADARACVREDERALPGAEDLCALTVEAAAMAKVPLAGTDWIR